MSRLARGVLVASAVLFCLPATAGAASVAVNTTLDEFADANGDCSLREAIQSVNTNTALANDCTSTGVGTIDTVTLPAGSYNLTISGVPEDGDAAGDLDVTNDLVIAGTGNPTITQSFSPAPLNNDRIIEVPASIGTNLTLRHLTVSGGRATQNGDAKGGCIQFQGASPALLELDDVNVLNCLASDTGGGQGGGVWSGGDVTIGNTSSIGGGAGNHAGQVAGSAGQGGGIYVEGADSGLTITDSEVKNNGAGDANGLLNEFGLGGGIYMKATGDSSLTLVDSAINDNTAGHGSLSDVSSGGGIYVDGGGSNAADISGGTVSGNVAGGGANNAAGNGGGIYFTPQSGGLGLQLGAVVSGNKAGGNSGTGSGNGGGIYSHVDLDLLDSIVSMNQAGVGTSNTMGQGGGIFMPEDVSQAGLSVETSTVAGNQAGSGTGQGSGGGIFLTSNGNLRISESLIDSNSSNTDAGGIRRDDPDGVPLPADIITASRISNNTAGPSTGGGFSGGMGFQTSGTLVIDRTTIDENAARGTATMPSATGAILFTSAFGSLGDSGDAGDLTIQNSTVFDNRASGGTAGGDGGGLVAVGDGDHVPPDVTIFHSTFSNNQAVPGTSTGGDGGNWLFVGLDQGLVIAGGNIVSNGLGNAGAQNCKADAGVINSGGGNVEGPAVGPFPSVPTNQCEFDQASDRQADPLLGPLAGNGGLAVGDPTTAQPTMTMALLGGSPAIDLSPGGVCPAVPASITADERGLHRPVGAACDSGAFEAQDADGDGVVDPNDSCPGTPGPAFHAGGCPLPPATTQPATMVNPLCAPLRKKLKKAKKAGDKAKVKKLRGKLRKLGC